MKWIQEASSTLRKFPLTFISETENKNEKIELMCWTFFKNKIKERDNTQNAQSSFRTTAIFKITSVSKILSSSCFFFERRLLQFVCILCEKMYSWDEGGNSMLPLQDYRPALLTLDYMSSGKSETIDLYRHRFFKIGFIVVKIR